METLYKMKNKKIIYPPLDTSRLICYLDSRGKKNTDTHRSTLLDLSGNGASATLRNVGFAAGSGYQSGALRFDGIDDYAELTLSKTMTTATIFVDFEPFTSFHDWKMITKIETTLAEAGEVYIANSRQGLIIDQYNPNTDVSIVTTVAPLVAGRNKVALTVSGSTLTAYYNGAKQVISASGSMTVQKTVSLFGDDLGGALNANFNQFRIYDTVLSDEEITKLMEE